MDGSDSSMQCSTRSIVTDYFEWRLKEKNPATNRLFSIVRQIGQDCEVTYRSQTRPLHFRCSSLTDLDTLKYIHHQIASNLFPNGDITWTRIISLISFSAILAEHLAQQEHLPVTFIIPSIIDWTTHYIDIELQSWLERENYWTSCLSKYDQTAQRTTSMSRYAGLLGTLGVITLSAFYITHS